MGAPPASNIEGTQDGAGPGASCGAVPRQTPESIAGALECSDLAVERFNAGLRKLVDTRSCAGWPTRPEAPSVFTLTLGVCAISLGSGAVHGGLVATSMTSLSVQPPTLLVYVNHRASCWPLI